MHSRPHQMNAHEQRHRHAEENTEEREPKIVEADGFVVVGEEAAGQETGPQRFRAICSVVVVGHACFGRPLKYDLGNNPH